MTIFKKINNHTYSIIIGALLTIIICRNIILSNAYPAGWDAFSYIYPINFFSENNRFLSIWEESNLGYVTPITLYNFLAPLNNYVNIINILFIFLNIGIYLSMYLFSYYFTKNKFISTTASIIYLTNQWIISHFSNGQLLYVFAYMLIPIIFTLLDICLNKENIKYYVLFSIILSITLLLRIDPVVYIFPFIFLYYLYHMLLNYRNINYPYIKKYFVKAIFIIVPLILFTFYIWYPLLKIPSIHTSITYDLNELKTTSLNVFDSFLGHGLIYSYIFWEGANSFNLHPFLSYPIYKLLMLIIPMLSISCIFISTYKRKLTTFLIGIAGCTIFLAKGVHPPFEWIYKILFNIVPLFNKLHEPNRWLMITWFSYSFLASISVYKIIKLAQSRLKNNLKKYIPYLTLVIITVNLGLVCPYIYVNGYKTWNPPTKEILPHQYIANTSNTGRVLSVPFGYSRMFTDDGYLTHDIGQISGIWNERPVLKHISLGSMGNLIKYIENLILKNDTTTLPKLLGIYNLKYIVLQGYPPTQPYHSSYEYFFKYTNAQQDFFRRQIGLEEKISFNNDSYSFYSDDKWERSLTIFNIPRNTQLLEIENPTVVLENSYNIPRIFVTSNQMFVLGGLNTLNKLSEDSTFNFSNWNILFANNLLDNPNRSELINQLNRSNYVLLYDSDIIDMRMILSNFIKINLDNFVNTGDWNYDENFMKNGRFVFYNDVITTNKNVESSSDIYIEEDDSYDIYIRLLNNENVENININLNENFYNISYNETTPNNNFIWYKIGNEYLQEGKHIFKIEYKTSNNIKITIDEILLVQSKSLSNSDAIVNQIQHKTKLLTDMKTNDLHELSPPTLTYDQINPSRYLININASDPCFVVFSDSYHPMWTVSHQTDSQLMYETIPSFTCINSFYIQETGNLALSLEFSGQNILNYSITLSGTFYLVALVFLVSDRARDYIKLAYDDKT